MDCMKEYKRWLDSPELEEGLRHELEAIAGDRDAINERFYAPLEFGTAGLRGIMGAGVNRMNVHVVRRAARGLADEINAVPGRGSRAVAIAYDSRNNSERFALETALTLAAAGVKARLFPSLRPVPMLSFTVKRLGCIAGVAITASHNPPEYNGFKVYWEDGGQCAPREADHIYSRMAELDYFGIPVLSEEAARESGLVETVGSEVDEAYYAAVISVMRHGALAKAEGHRLKLVYTPLHGAGLVPVTTALERAGFTNVSVVPEQREPDGDFPTVKAPNPELPEVFTLAEALADREGADVILATDPDSDRLGVAVRDGGEFTVLTGNMIGSLLLHYILSSMDEAGALPKDGFAVRSIVTTHMADAICARYGIRLYDVPTGFRFIAEKLNEAESSGRGTFVFAFEESYGFLAGSYARDKDAVSAALLVAEAALYYGKRNMTLMDAEREMGAIYGHFGERTKSFTLPGIEGLGRIADAMKELRANPPRSFGGIDVAKAEDLLSGEVKTVGGGAGRAELSGINVLRYTLSNGAWICVRPSGTEPKLKLYLGASAPTEESLIELMKAVSEDAEALIAGMLRI